MNEKLNNFLTNKQAENRAKLDERLINAGIYEKEYADEWSEEYDNYDKEQKKYYKKLPVKLTDEEIELFEKYDDGEDNGKTANTVYIMNTVAIVIYLIGFAVGISFARYEVTTTVIFWGAAFISGSFFLALGKIISQLEKINANTSKFRQR